MEFLNNHLMPLKTLLIDLVIFGGIFYVVEKLKPAEKDITFFKPEFREEVAIAAINRLITVPIITLLSTLAIIKGMAEYFPYQIFDEYIQRWPLELQVLFALFINDFSTYWRHRMMHKALWSVHSIHHSARHLTWITGLRLHPVEVVIAAVIDGAFMYVFGFDGPAILSASILGMLYNYYLHANVHVEYAKPLRWVFASPHFHRWHHATDKAAYDKNFCSMFSLIDLMFGTYYHPEGALPRQYGLSDAEQRNYPSNRLGGQLLYPFRRRKTKAKAKLKAQKKT